jgi:pyruvate formate lyase activating enzyme
MTIDEVMTEIEKDKIFYDQSGGGVTFSGGEPFAQADFLENMLEHCLQHDIHTVIETTGQAAPEVFQRVARKADIILYDFKIMDNARHKKFTGVDNDLILENLRWLAAHHKQVELRFPVIPGINDDAENVLALAKLAKSLHVRGVHLLPYHQSGLAKYRRLNRRYRLEKLAPPTPERLSDISAKLKKAAIKVIDGD